MNTFIVLLMAHLIGDYVLQQSDFFALKRFSFCILMVHATIWTVSICIALKLLGRFKVWKFWFSLCVHTLIDYWKPLLCSVSPTLTIMLADQFLHMAQIYAVSWKIKHDK